MYLAVCTGKHGVQSELIALLAMFSRCVVAGSVLAIFWSSNCHFMLQSPAVKGSLPCDLLYLPDGAVSSSTLPLASQYKSVSQALTKENLAAPFSKSKHNQFVPGSVV